MKRNMSYIAVLIIFVCLLPMLLTEYGANLAAEIFIMGIFAMSLGLIMGYAGMVSLGHAAFFAIGAYTVSILGESIQNTYLLILAAVVFSGVIALITGYVFIRTSKFYFLMITLAFGQLIYALAWQLKEWTGGADGMVVRSSFDLGFGELYSPLAMYFVMGAAFILVYALLRFFVDSPAGKITKGVMENETRMAALGFNTSIYKLLTYSLAGVLAGFSGALYGYYNLFVSPDLSMWMFSGQVLNMVIIGGVGTLMGPALGAGIFIFLQNFISTYTERWPLIMGVLLVILVLIGKGGVIHWLGYLKHRVKWKSKRSQAFLGRTKVKEGGAAK